MSTSTHPNDGCIIVVDDPQGIVAPSHGVKIVGRSQGKTLGIIGHRGLTVLVYDMLPHVEFTRTEMMLSHSGQVRVSVEKKQQEPMIRGRKTKERKLHKGLRP